MTSSFLRVWTDRPRWALAPFWLLTALVLLLPLFVWFPAQDSFVLPKRVLLGAGTVLLAAGVLALSAFGLVARLPLHPVNGFLLGILAWQALSVTWSQAPALAWDQVRETGLLVLFALAAQSLLMHDRRRLLALVWVFCGACALVALWAVVLDFAAAFAPDALPVRRVLFDWRDVVSTASLGNSGHVADLVTMGFLATLAVALTTRSRVAFGMAAVVLWLESAALIVAWSVHSNLSLVVGSAVLVALGRDWRERRSWRRRLRQRLAVLAVGWALVVGFYTIDHPANPHGSRVWAGDSGASGGIFAQAFQSERWKAGGPTRLAIWYTTLEVVRAHPWLGAGAGNFTFVYPATRSALVENDERLAPYAGSWTNAAHNDLLQVWSETGILGVFLLVGLVGVAFFEMNRLRKEERSPGNRLVLAGAMAMLTAFCVQAQMNFPLELPVSSALFVVLLGVPVVLPRRSGVRDLLMPVWRDFGPLRIGIMLKNMQWPTEFHVGFQAGRALTTVFVAVVLVAGGWGAWGATAPLRSSVVYRGVYEGMRRPEGLASPAQVEILVRQARRALAIDPRNIDCRSGLTDLLVRTGRHSEALAELPEVRRRLNAFEVFLREAVALDATGRGEEALAAWRELFVRRPQLIEQFPDRFQAIRSREPDFAP
jgi:O-antigen ligase